MNPLQKLPEAMNELLNSFMSQPLVGTTTFGLTTYVFWMLVATTLLVVAFLVFMKLQKRDLAPHGFFVNAMESVVTFIRDDMCKSILGDTWKKHFPFLSALFLFICANSIVGIIPGAHPGTGTMGVTLALATCSFVYFVWVGISRMGVIGYLKSMAPEGVSGPMAVLVWAIELISTFLRLITLAVRLFCNMFAGHIVMGTFAILTALFVEPLLQEFSIMALTQAGASIFWMLLLLLIYVVEIMVGIIQAYVFTLLSSVYIQLVESEH